MRPAPSLFGVMPRIAPRPALLIAAGGVEAEIPTNTAYRDAGGPNVRSGQSREPVTRAGAARVRRSASAA